MTISYLGGKVKQYCWNMLLGFDHLLNAFLGGDPHETLSSRLWRNRDKRGIPAIIWVVEGFFGPGHCQRSLEPSEMHTNEVIR